MPVDRYREICAQHRWRVPPDFNIAQAVCRRHAPDRARVAIHWEDEDGAAATLTYDALQQQADRLSNALAALGVGRGDKIAIILPQRPETAIAHVACYQLGAVAVPLSFLFGPDALEYRLDDSGAKAVFVDPASLPHLAAVRDRLAHLRHVIGVAGAREAWTIDWSALQERAASDFQPVPTLAADPALLVYTSGTTGPPKGALMPQQCLLGNLPGFVHSHDSFPQQGDLFWSPADWAWTGGLMDALLPTLYFGLPVVGYRGRFEPERALALMAKYRVRNAFLFPTALKMMMKAVPRPGERYALELRSVMSAGTGRTRRDDQRDVRTNRDELHRRQLACAVAGEAGIHGPPVSGPSHRADRRCRGRGGRRRTRRSRGEPRRSGRRARSRVLSRVLQQPRSYGAQVQR
jgi:acetyl-CoA synthetase